MANVRKLYLHTDPDIGHVEGRSLTIRSDERPLTFVSKETVDIGLTLLTGGSDSLEVVQIGGTPELAFVIKRVGAQTGEALALCQSFAWDSTEEAYLGSLNIDTLQMRAVFNNKVDAVEHSGASHDLALADVAKLIAFTHSGDFTVNLKAQADVAWADGATIAILNNSTHVLTLDPATAVTINGSTSNITIAGGDLYVLTRTASNTWTAAEAEEEDEIEARGQWAYRDAGSGLPYTYGPDIAVTVRDAYFRDSEAIPESTADPTVYVTDAELEAQVAAEVAATLTTAVETEVEAQITALGYNRQGVVFPNTTDMAFQVTGDTTALLSMDELIVTADSVAVGDVFQFAMVTQSKYLLTNGLRFTLEVNGEGYDQGIYCIATATTDSDAWQRVTLQGWLHVAAIGATGKVVGFMESNFISVDRVTSHSATESNIDGVNLAEFIHWREVDTTADFTLRLHVYNNSVPTVNPIRLLGGYLRKVL